MKRINLPEIFNITAATLILTLLIVILTLGAIIDFAYYRLPNRLFYIAFYLYPLFIILTGRHEELMNYSLFLIFLIVGFILFAAGVIGGGDAKFLAVVSLWVGWNGCQLFLITLLVMGAGLALAYVFAPITINYMTTKTRRFIESHSMIRSIIFTFVPDALKIESNVLILLEKRMIPYGVAITLAGLVVISGKVG